jgi:valyl-tRNA synthetase
MTIPSTSGPELSSTYDPAALEEGIYRRWIEAGAFTADAARSVRAGGDRAPFVIVMPPPNVTAVLHMGHGLNNTVQDVIVRWRRMKGDETLWLPGTDHAGIATQNVIEKQLAAEGTSRDALGRERFVQRTAAFVESTGGTILEQLRAIGASCDWTRTAYTLSPELSSAVREAFVTLHERGLIYRGHRVIHWCPRCLTSLSDEEAEHHDTSGSLYHVRYALADDPSQSITVATTRPETMLGDVAIAVHPADERYRAMVGRTVRLPITGIEIPIIADESTDPEFGSGAVKITPAHDPNDFEVGLRHDLPAPVVISPTGIMREGAEAAGRVPAQLDGLDRFVARQNIVELLRQSGELVRVEPHQHAVRHCYRCDTVVEPRLSDQWFVSMAPLAAQALQAVRDGELRILPERWVGVYTHWMENIRDWNISRQLWWGHRIPVWYCDACGGEPLVRREAPDACPSCGGAVRQDEDVLDTWFSSWLWPFSTLGWPRDDARDLVAFYPTDMLVTAPEILFFWVARMVMAGYAFMGRAPFHTVYLHGTVRDTQHVKMSKSLGNGIDPLDVVRRYGADALRYTVVAGMGMGADLILDPADLEQSFTPGRNFATKLWNIGRFLLSNVGDEQVLPFDSVDPSRLTRADSWILERLNSAILEIDSALGPARPQAKAWAEEQLTAGLRLSEYAETARRFVWNELADWYVETTKSRLTPDSPDRDVARAVLVHVFDAALKLLHPVVPFITEALWQRLPVRDGAAGSAPDDVLALAAWPDPIPVDEGAAREFLTIMEAVSAIRQLRADYSLPPGTKVDVFLSSANARGGAALSILEEEAGLVERLTRSSIHTDSSAPSASAAHALLGTGVDIAMPLAGLVDLDRECARIGGELTELTGQLDALRARLANERFTTRAPAHVVEGERAREREWSLRRELLAAKLEALCGGS